MRKPENGNKGWTGPLLATSKTPCAISTKGFPDKNHLPKIAVRALGVRMRLSATFSGGVGLSEWNLH